MKRTPFWIVALLAVATLPGCSKNKAATAKCKDSHDCAACCKAAGATGNASGTVNGVYSCRCMGGE